ncbi:MAG: 4Fe-4S dicluster domain-containing protein [Dehalococcoidia bacterium]|nr:4Fe-4S dicluster domain-containing protein [Dehalococcoidia bacterium]
MALRIEAGCINCGNCRHVCPTAAIRYFDTADLQHRIEPAACIDCGLCVDACPVEVIVPDTDYVHDAAVLAGAKALAARTWRTRGPQIQAVLRVMRQRNARWANERDDRRANPERYATGQRLP